jgi:hypothetical protein
MNFASIQEPATHLDVSSGTKVAEPGLQIKAAKGSDRHPADQAVVKKRQ